MDELSIKEQLERQLKVVDSALGDLNLSGESYATLQLTISNILIGLQKYEVDAKTDCNVRIEDQN